MKRNIIAMAAALVASVVMAKPSFTMRIDDNHSPVEWKRGADITPEQLADGIKKRIDSGKYHVTLSHMRNNKLSGGIAEYFEKTERFAKLISDSKISSLTMSETLDDRFGEAK